ncbi:DNA polymerase Y family protein [Occallatibacter riparius]|uniref:DNA polymerase n=1 Tax=Occallatibacter riparius TaxID=1002689 RepID=A0A9J7BVV6_9BACT|nr:DNA polymerase [Occallatibacter riparius]UWZ85022.1 DNA polymerase [Occallatibacter riparius]
MEQPSDTRNSDGLDVPAPGFVSHAESREVRSDSQGPHLNWLFVDLNSYFASVEQQDRPELRGKPVGVVPMLADTTVCIAASYEAKAFGVRTGTVVADARRMCPGIVFVEGRHELYTEYHHRVVEAVESCLPVTAVCSIDEMACRLMGRERPLLAALELGRKVKSTIRARVGDCLRSSVGLATNRYLAKVASDMEKPDGLVALPKDILPEALARLTLRDLPGIGAKTEKRLNDKGITTMAQLMALDADQSGQLWGSVWGTRLWHWLRGEDFEMSETDHLKSISHQHVLSPDMRTRDQAWAVAHKLLHKAAMRLRSNHLWASAVGLAVGFSVPRASDGSPTPVSSFGVPAKGFHAELRITESQDNTTLIAALRKLWDQQPAGGPSNTPYFVGVTLNGLIPDRLHTLSLFDATEDEQSRAKLLKVMDQINNKYGLSTLAPATMLTAWKAAPTRIAFHSIPDLF